MYQYLFSITVWLDDKKSQGLELQKRVSLENVPNLNADLTIDDLTVRVEHMIWLHNKDMFFVILKDVEAKNDIETFEAEIEKYKAKDWKPSFTFHDIKDRKGVTNPRKYKDGISLN